MDKTVYDFIEREQIGFITSKDIEPEVHFSWWPCDCCNDSLGVDRFDIIAKDSEGILEYAVCPDCYVQLVG